jgi:hypothetical protein
VPDRRHAADDRRADEREHEAADLLRLEHADHRSLRANRPGTPRAVVGFTENSAPGTWIIRLSTPSHGMWMRW